MNIARDWLSFHSLCTVYYLLDMEMSSIPLGFGTVKSF